MIDFLESRINFRDKEDFNLTQELFGGSNQLASHLPEIPESQLAQLDQANRSIEI